LELLEYVNQKITESFTFIIKNTEFYIPINNNYNVAEEINKLMQELDYTKGFLQSVLKKLSNEKFVNNAAAQIVEAERKKQIDAEAKIKVIEEQLASLKK